MKILFATYKGYKNAIGIKFQTAIIEDFLNDSEFIGYSIWFSFIKSQKQVQHIIDKIRDKGYDFKVTGSFSNGKIIWSLKPSEETVLLLRLKFPEQGYFRINVDV